MPSVLEAVSYGQRALRRREPAYVQALLAAYTRASRRVERELAALEWHIAQAVESGADVTETWLTQQVWYRQMQASIQAEYARFAGEGAQVLGAAQSGAVSAALESGALLRASIGVPFAGRVNAGAVERWVSAIQPGSPVRAVLDKYGARASAAIQAGMVEGMGAGRGPRQIAREIARQIGPEANEARLLTVVRTETHRALRGAFSTDMEPLERDGTIVGYVWRAALSDRTCGACLGRHGQYFRQYPTGWHVNCRCVAVPRISDAILPGTQSGRYASGEQWLRKQDAATQRRIMRSNEAYDLFRDGEPLSSFVGVRQSATWGPAIYLRPASVVAQRKR